MKKWTQDDMEALAELHRRGAFLVRAGADKTPIRRLKQPQPVYDESGEIMTEPDPNGVPRAKTEERVVRCDLPDIARHVGKGGLVLWYAPGRLGLMVLDFDPLLPERLDSIEAVLGSPAHRSYESSGRLKPARGSTPAGKGGHACWRVLPERAEEARRIRQFGAVEGGDSYGEAFTSHPGFGVIVWDPTAMLETLELDEAEAVDPTLLPKAAYALGRKGADGEWEGGEGSRHDSAMSAIARSALGCGTEEAFEDDLERIREAFVASVGAERDAEGEWARMAAKGREYWASDRAADLINAERTAAIGKGRRSSGDLDETAAAVAGGAEEEGFDPVGNLLARLRRDGIDRYPSYADAERECLKSGVLVLPGEYRDETLHEAYATCGFSFRWNDLMQRLEIDDRGEWKPVGKSGLEGARLRAGVNEVTRRCAVIVQVKEKGEPTGEYRITRIVHSRAWGKNATDFYGAMMGCVGPLIPSVNPLSEWVVRKVEEFDAKPPEERARLVQSLDRVFLDLPGLRVPEGAHTRLAAHCGRYLFTMLGHRALQSHPEYAQREVKVQRNVPVIAGSPGSGKTTAMRLLRPRDMPVEKAYVELDITKDPDEIRRLVAGVPLGLFDDIDQVAGPYGGRSKGHVKALVTMTQMDFRWMRENPVSVINPCTFVGTANELNLPNDEGTQVRFVPFLVESDRRDGESGNNAARRLEKHILENLDGWITAGLSLAVADESFELDTQGLVDQRVALGDVAADPGDMKAVLTAMIEGGEYRLGNGKPAIAPYQVAHRMGWLKVPYSLDAEGGRLMARGDNIVYGESDVSDSALLSAYNGSGSLRQWGSEIRQGMSKVGWTLNRSLVIVGHGKGALSSTYRPGVGGLLPPEAKPKPSITAHENVVPLPSVAEPETRSSGFEAPDDLDGEPVL